MPNTLINPERIAATELIIRPHIRRTPVLEADGADFGLASIPLLFKLELLQYSGSFKARGAFANLLLRQIPQAGVVAASGGNHGAAVAFAAMKLGVPAKIFVPTVASLEKIERIRGYGADLVVTGERYAEALALVSAGPPSLARLPCMPTTSPRRCSARAPLLSNSTSAIISIPCSWLLAAVLSAASPLVCEPHQDWRRPKPRRLCTTPHQSGRPSLARGCR
jgi:hypothetical protein